MLLIPPDESNAFHRAVKQVLPHLPSHLQRPFLRFYIADVDETIATGQYRGSAQAANSWRNTLCSWAEHPQSDFWR